METTKKKGRGRPKGSKAKHTIKAEEARRYVIDRVVTELEDITTAQIEASKGLYLEELDKKTGERIRVYQEKPDLKAGEYLLNQGIGKAKENVEIAQVKKLSIDF